MIELPEATTLARQMNATLVGKTIQSFARGELKHKFLWLNQPAEDYHARLAGQPISGASAYGRSIYLCTGSDLMLWFGELGGRILYHAPGEPEPAKVHLRWQFTDGSTLTYNLQMWGFVRLLARAEFNDRPYAEVGLPPLHPDFTLERFEGLLEAYPEKTKKGVKGFLVTSQHVNGIGNSYLQDILFRARLHPGRKIPTLSQDERARLYDAIQETLAQAVALDGRVEERDLFDQPGRYLRLMSAQTAGSPCPVCGAAIEKIAYLGGACYLCPHCQEA